MYVIPLALMKIHKNIWPPLLLLFGAYLKNLLKDLIYKNQQKRNFSEIEGRRNILRKIIDIILFLGKQRLTFKRKFEGAYSLSEADRGKKFVIF